MRLVLGFFAALAFAQVCSAETYPSKLVNFVVPFAPGGASDIMARAVGQKLSDIWKQPVIIDNKPGASTTLGTAYAATQPADGYTLLLAPLPFVLMPHVYSNLRYKLDDFRAVAVIAYYPLVVAVDPALPVHNLKDLIEYLRKNPGKAYASVGPGSSPHLMGAYMSREEKLDTVHVPYRSGGQVFPDVMAGRTAFYAGPTTEVVPQAAGGKVRAIAVLSEKRIKQLPDVPTSVEQGYAKYVGSSWSSIVVPAKTPNAVVDKIAKDINEALNDRDFRSSLEQQGAQFIDSATPAQAAEFLVKEDKLWAPRVQASGVKPEN